MDSAEALILDDAASRSRASAVAKSSTPLVLLSQYLYERIADVEIRDYWELYSLIAASVQAAHLCVVLQDAGDLTQQLRGVIRQLKDQSPVKPRRTPTVKRLRKSATSSPAASDDSTK